MKVILSWEKVLITSVCNVIAKDILYIVQSNHFNTQINGFYLSQVAKETKDNTQPQGSANTTKTPHQLEQSPTKQSEIKVRLTSSNGKTATVSLKAPTTYSNLQETIQAELGIPKERQKIRYGFPPRELKPPEEEHAVLPLTHGDRVSVEELPDVKAQEDELLKKEAESMDVEVEGKGNGEEASALASSAGGLEG